MIAPATLLIFIFGLFPVAFALFVSVHKWRLKRGDFIGLDNYTRAAADLAYVALFAVGVGALILAALLLRRIVVEFREGGARGWPLAAVGAAHAAAVIGLLRWGVLLLPELLDIADKIRGLERTRELFMGLLGDAFRAEAVLPAFRMAVAAISVALILGAIALRLWRDPRNLPLQVRFALIWLSISTGVFISAYTYREATRAYQDAMVAGTDPGIWPQIITMGSGLILLVLAWLIWRQVDKSESIRSFWLRILAAMALLVGGWLLIGELPMVIAAGDDDMWSGLKNTIFYSVGTIPFQLAISLFLAILLFQNLAGSEVLRMLFFLPYVTPFVASAAVFKQMFSIRPQSPVNQLVQAFGLESMRWVQEPIGVFKLIGQRLGVEIPGWAAGPSLALVVIMIFSIWVFVGYDTVIYMAGLGNISSELTEAAEIDGANRWQIFRHVIFPLLSPTTYFLSLISIIGTFKAFTHIWVMRHDLSLNTTYTFSVTIFDEFFTKVQFGYASALAFILFAIIISLTVINNRLQGSRVFYG